MGTDKAVSRPLPLHFDGTDGSCQAYTVRGVKCKRRGTCWSDRTGRCCVQHMREAEPRSLLWLL